MRQRVVFQVSMLAVSLLFIACSTNRAVTPTSPTSPPASGSCEAQKAGFAIGQSASDDLLERARAAAGARSARFLRPNQVITLEFLGSRLNVNLDANDIVRSVTCG